MLTSRLTRRRRALPTYGVASLASTAALAACATLPGFTRPTSPEAPMTSPTIAATPPNTTIAASVPSANGRDHAAVTEVITRIAHGADLHQWEAVRAALAPAVRLDYGTPEELTADAIVARWQPLLEAFDATQHQLFGVEVAVDGDRATAVSRFRATHVLRGAPGGDVWTLAGRYEYALARTHRGWQVTAMRMVPESSTGNATLLDHARARAPRAVPQAADRATAERERNRATVRAFFATLEALGSGEQVAALFAEGGTQVMPFAPPGFPARLEGRAAIARQYGGLPAAFASMRFPDLVIRDLASPTEFFATYRGDIALKAGGKYDNDYAGYFVVRDGRIAEFHEFFNPLVLQRAFGGQLDQTFSVPR